MDATKPIAALFDFDGVIMDTESQYSIFWSKQGRKYHPQIKNFENVIKGSTLEQILGLYFDDQPQVRAKIQNELIEFEKNMKYEYVPGVVEFLKDLREHQVKIAVVTSSNNEKMENVYHSHPEFETMVDKIFTAEYFTKSKPDPECYLIGASYFKTPVDNCFVFEDSFNGLKAGNSANMTVIGLSTTNSREKINEFSKLVIDNFLDFDYECLMKTIN